MQMTSDSANCQRNHYSNFNINRIVNKELEPLLKFQIFKTFLAILNNLKLLVFKIILNVNMTSKVYFHQQ